MSHKFYYTSAALELSTYTLAAVIHVSEYYKHEYLLETNFSDWKAGDVVDHINGRIKFSEDTLKSIKIKRSLEDANHADTEEFNKTNYEKNKRISLEDAADETKIIMANYDEEELLSKEFPAGFSLDLWKDMAMDVYIHPIIHIPHRYIKRKDYNEFIELMKGGGKNFTAYSDDDIKVYYFGDLFKNTYEKEKRLRALKALMNDNKDETAVKAIRIHME
jgi:hypothetical protein